MASETPTTTRSAPTGASLLAPWQEATERMLAAQAGLVQEALRGQLATLEEMRALRARLTGPRQDQAVFKARVTSGGRISVPDTEREALGLTEGDLVQVILVPVRKDRTLTPTTQEETP